MTIATRMREIRIHLNLTVADMANRAGLNRKTWDHYEAGRSLPNAETLARLVGMGFSATWLLTGAGDLRAGASGGGGAATVPILGLAECGLRGWYQPRQTGLFAATTANISTEDNCDVVAVLAVGGSMRPAGINPGDLAYCAPVDPVSGASVLVESTDGHLALKRWLGQQNGWVIFQGWLDDSTSPAQDYLDRRLPEQLIRIWPVIHVAPALARHLIPTNSAAQPDEQDRLYELSIATVLDWYQEQELTQPSPANLAGLVSRAVRQIRARADTRTQSAADLSAEVRTLLDIAQRMILSGDIPRR